MSREEEASMNNESPHEYMSLADFCVQHLGYLPTQAELAMWEEEIQALCREKGHVWFHKGRPVVPSSSGEQAP